MTKTAISQQSTFLFSPLPKLSHGCDVSWLRETPREVPMSTINIGTFRLGFGVHIENWQIQGEAKGRPHSLTLVGTNFCFWETVWFKSVSSMWIFTCHSFVSAEICRYLSVARIAYSLLHVVLLSICHSATTEQTASITLTGGLQWVRWPSHGHLDKL